MSGLFDLDQCGHLKIAVMVHSSAAESAERERGIAVSLAQHRGIIPRHFAPMRAFAFLIALAGR
jgi:hypothetical protein